MINAQIIDLVKSGFLTITTHCLDNTSAYSVFKFKKAVSNIFNNLATKEREMLLECEIENIENTSNDKLQKFYDFRRQLLLEETSIGYEVKPIDYDSWRKLQDENKANEFMDKTVDVLSGDAELLLEGVLWIAE